MGRQTAAAGRIRVRASLDLRKKPAFASVTILACLGALELASRLLILRSPNARWKSNREMVKAFGFPALNDLFQADEKLFWSLRPDLRDLHLEGRTPGSPIIRFTVSTDHEGRRLMSSSGAARNTVLFLGDSCTFGFGVDDDQTFPSLVQKDLPDLRCINCGVPGYTSFQGRVLLEQLAPDPPPIAVVINFGFNDEQQWDDLSDVEHAAIIAADGDRLMNQIGICRMLRSTIGSPFPVPSAGSATRKRSRLTDDEYAEQICLILQHCHKAGWEPILLVWPQFVQMSFYQLEVRKHGVLRKIADEHHIPIVDLVPAFRSGRMRGPLFVDAVHASQAGCQLVAQSLLPVLRNGTAETRDLPRR